MAVTCTVQYDKRDENGEHFTPAGQPRPSQRTYSVIVSGAKGPSPANVMNSAERGHLPPRPLAQGLFKTFFGSTVPSRRERR